MLVATVTFESASSAKKALSSNGKVLVGRTLSVEQDFMGLTVLGTPKHPKLDIIAVHGLNGHAYGTWAHYEAGQPGVESMWLRDFLPDDVEQARILVYGYNSALLGSNTSVSSVKDFAHDLLQRIIDDRADQDNSRPLIFICHSLGGIVIKQALVSAHADPKRYHSLAATTRSIIFLATPHGGSKSANIGSLLSHVASLAFQSPSKQLLETLKHNSDILSRLSEEFRKVHSAFDIVNFYERRKTPGLNSLIVDEASSKLGVESELLIPIDATHRRICKFHSRTDPLFLPVLAQIKRCSNQVIQAEDERVETESAPTIANGHFMVPVAPNSTEQLQLLEDFLSAQDYDTRSSYPIVAIHGLGGVGKTQLATRYVYDRKLKKPGASVFWVSARNDKEIEAGFREFAKKLSLVHNAGGAVHARPNLTATAKSAAEIGSQPDGVDLLKNWMLSPGHEDWLLVLDNFDDIEVKVDRFFPKGASGSVLITTRDRNVIGSVATSGFHLTAMDLLDAERLFIRIQNLGADPHLQGSASGPERQILKQILEELQCFPLAIDQAASFIRENSPMTLREYQTYLKPRSVDRERLLRFKQANPAYPDSVMTTWEISLHYLERNHPRAGWILQLLGFLDHSYISEELLITATKRIPWIFDTSLDGKQLCSKYQSHVAFLKDDVEFRVAIGTLASLSLIQRHMAGATLHVHPLVHEWIRVRLNPEPKKQARFTIVGALLLFQYLPSEMLVWLCSRPEFHLQEVHHRINQVSHHIGVVLSNLADYAVHATTTPLECFMLCEVYFLAGFSRHSDLPFGVPTELSQDLDHLIKMMISRMPHDQRSLARFIHKVILWLGGSLRQKDHMVSVSRITDSLESLKAQVLRAECPDEVFMLLAHCVVEVCDTLKNTFPEKLVFDNGKNHKKIEDKKERFRRTSYRLLESVRSVFSSIKPLSTLLRRTRLAITIRLLTVMTPEEYATQNWLDIEKDLISEEIGHLDFDEKAAFLCLLAQLLWEYQGPKDFLALQKVFSAVISECSAMRENERRLTALQRDRAPILAMSRSRYISSSFGREINPTGRNKGRNIITPLNYIWTITPILAETTSDPKQQWRTLYKEDSCIGSLDLSQRRWSLNLISSISKIYRGYCAERGIISDIDARYFNHFDELSVRYRLINIYANLEDWQKLQRELVVLLQCDEVLRFCNRLQSLPWEHRQVADTQGDDSSPPPSQTPQQDSKHTSWLLLATRPFKAAKNLVTGQASQTHDAPNWSAEPALVSKLQDTAAEIEARLEAAAAQRLSRAPAKNLNAPLPQESELEGNCNKTSKVQSLGLPDSCNCIADRNVGKAITQFFTLAQRWQLLDEREASDLRLKIRVVANMPSESFAKYLGNFEIIDQLAQKLSASHPDSMHVEYATDDDGFGDPSHAVSLDEETDDEEVNDNFELGISPEMTGFDWGW